MILFLQAIADRLFGPGPNLETLAQNYSLVLSNSHFSINEVRPLVPGLVEVGGMHLDDTQSLARVSSLLLLYSKHKLIKLTKLLYLFVSLCWILVNFGT